MTKNNAKLSHYPKKIFLAVFIFALVILVGKIIYTQFDSISLSFTSSEQDADLASIVAPEFFHEKAIETGNQADTGLTLYRSDISKADVLWFYAHITGDETISRIILENASKNNVSPPLAFALAYEESRYQPRAVNKNATSIDRGLYQLNNKAFPNLTEKDFYNPEKSAQYGLTHLSYCLDLSGNEVAALAMYNAGTTKVSNDKTPKRTLDYVSRILSYKDGLEKLFNQQVASRYRIDENDKVTLSGKHLSKQ
jgi:soluble lytic murein transglycosylase-like protein